MARASKSFYVLTDEERARLPRIPITLPAASSASQRPNNDPYRPKTFDEYIGQEDAKRLARIIIAAAKAEKRGLPNTLITGEYGLGKTTLARIIISTFGTREVIVDPKATIPTSGTIIVDEIHNLPTDIADSLHKNLDSSQLTIIGCTTNPGELTSAFRSRFRQLLLTPYTENDLKSLISTAAIRTGRQLDKATTSIIAARSRFNARAAVQNLKMVIDLSLAENKPITQKLALEVFDLLGIDDRGLTKIDHKYLNSLKGRPVGLQYLSAVLGADKSTIETEIEPYLLRLGLIDRTPKGRIRL